MKKNRCPNCGKKVHFINVKEGDTIKAGILTRTYHSDNKVCPICLYKF